MQDGRARSGWLMDRLPRERRLVNPAGNYLIRPVWVVAHPVVVNLLRTGYAVGFEVWLHPFELHYL